MESVEALNGRKIDVFSFRNNEIYIKIVSESGATCGVVTLNCEQAEDLGALLVVLSGCPRGMQNERLVT